MIEAVFLAALTFVAFGYALYAKDMLAGALSLSIAGICAAAFFLVLQAPDVALAQAAVGGGIIPFIYFMALAKTERFEK